MARPQGGAAIEAFSSKVQPSVPWRLSLADDFAFMVNPTLTSFITNV